MAYSAAVCDKPLRLRFQLRRGAGEGVCCVFLLFFEGVGGGGILQDHIGANIFNASSSCVWPPHVHLGFTLGRALNCGTVGSH